MFKVNILSKPISQIQKYIKSYRIYHEELYQDSWIWGEEEILRNYEIEAWNRYIEIKTLLQTQLSHSIVSYSNDETIIRWRSKILLVSFKEKWDTRTITHIEIR